jgi:hypothetical protein
MVGGGVYLLLCRGLSFAFYDVTGRVDTVGWDRLRVGWGWERKGLGFGSLVWEGRGEVGLKCVFVVEREMNMDMDMNVGSGLGEWGWWTEVGGFCWVEMGRGMEMEMVEVEVCFCVLIGIGVMGEGEGEDIMGWRRGGGEKRI